MDQRTYQQSVIARGVFYDTIGLPYLPEDIDSLNARTKMQDRHPTITPLKTTIGTLRVLSEYDLNVAIVVNTLPATLGLAPTKINMTAYTLMKYGLWEDSNYGTGMKQLINRGEQLNIFTTPLESMLLYFSAHPTGNNAVGLGSRIVKYVSTQGITPAQRKPEVHKVIANQASRQRLGYLAVLYAMKEKTANQYNWKHSHTAVTHN